MVVPARPNRNVPWKTSVFTISKGRVGTCSSSPQIKEETAAFLAPKVKASTSVVITLAIKTASKNTGHTDSHGARLTNSSQRRCPRKARLAGQQHRYQTEPSTTISASDHSARICCIAADDLARAAAPAVAR